jgi:hypothetical protein
VTAVSRFTTVRSADLSSDAIGPNAVAGRRSSFAVLPVKCTSPANASVTAPAAALAGTLVRAARAAAGVFAAPGPPC